MGEGRTGKLGGVEERKTVVGVYCLSDYTFNF